ncbi:unnamed protein product [Litomosoides sigmodontis]|uniref:Peptidase M12B domain-containing protein n=1 Tax=Litomosoides sigmodontis TaxID=42156 RepID=A0A3P6T968_LITSI|nr:unnamed protein product [Litomosoides sigmodontis]
MRHNNSYQIDILMVADYSVYTNFLHIVRGDEYSAFFATEDYLYAIFEQWKSEYIKAKSLSIRMSGLDAVNYVQKWMADYSQWIPPHNHIIVLTRVDLLSSKGESNIQGMAYVGAMCRVAESASVVEDIGGMATAVIAAHELAHSLGAFHDGATGGAEKCKKNYLMSATVSSSDDEQIFFNTFKLSGTADCLLRSKSRERRLRRTSQRKLRRPGELLVQQHQCKIAFGPHYSVCTRKEYLSQDPCRRLWCKNRQLRKTEPCETKVYLPLLDGTKCGPDKVNS